MKNLKLHLSERLTSYNLFLFLFSTLLFTSCNKENNPDYISLTENDFQLIELKEDGVTKSDSCTDFVINFNSDNEFTIVKNNFIDCSGTQLLYENMSSRKWSFKSKKEELHLQFDLNNVEGSGDAKFYYQYEFTDNNLLKLTEIIDGGSVKNRVLYFTKN